MLKYYAEGSQIQTREEEFEEFNIEY